MLSLQEILSVSTGQTAARSMGSSHNVDCVQPLKPAIEVRLLKALLFRRQREPRARCPYGAHVGPDRGGMRAGRFWHGNTSFTKRDCICFPLVLKRLSF